MMTTPCGEDVCQDAKYHLDDFVNYITTDRVIDENDPGQIADVNQDLVCPICSNILLNPQDCIQCDTSFCDNCI
jgi:hypothetical protein